MPSSALSEVARIDSASAVGVCMLSMAGLTGSTLPVKSRQRTQARIGERDCFEQFAHAVRSAVDQPNERLVHLLALRTDRARPQHARPLLDAEPPQEFALRERAEHGCALAGGGAAERAEVDMGG